MGCGLIYRTEASYLDFIAVPENIIACIRVNYLVWYQEAEKELDSPSTGYSFDDLLARNLQSMDERRTERF